jgi:hypothetical protein
VTKQSSLSESYVGTELNGKWWKSYRKDGFFVRGNGLHTFEEDALTFKRLLMKEPLRIPYSAISGVRTGTWHAGKWLAGRPIVKVDWTAPDGSTLSSGFGFATDEMADAMLSELNRMVERVPSFGGVE